MSRAEKIKEELRDADNSSEPNDFEEYWINRVGETLYNMFVNQYSKKMWMLDDNKTIDDFTWSPKGVTLKEGPREAWDTAISAYPHARNGYDDYFEIATQDTTVLLETRIEAFDIPNKAVIIHGERQTYDVVVNTVSPDIIMNFEHGELPFIGRDFYKFVLLVY